MGKKNLDQLFQEKFKDFSKEPDEKIWQRIAVTLDKKKKSRRIIPFWWKIGGAAAVLAFLIFTMNPFNGILYEENEVITDVRQSETEDEPHNEQNIKVLEGVELDEDKVVDKSTSIKENRDPDQNGSIGRTSPEEAKEAVVASETGKNSAPKTDAPRSGNGKTEIVESGTTNQLPHEEKEDAAKNDEKGRAIFQNKREELIASKVDDQENNPQNKAVEKNDTNMKSGKIEPIIGETNEDAIVQNVEENSKAVEENEGKKSIFDEIEEDEVDEVVEGSGGKWAVGANVAPVYFNSFGEGSPIHSSFVANSKSGDINMSYGLSVSYQVSKKLRIRSGISKVDYGYNTNDVEFSSSLASSTNGEITNIDYARTSANLVVESSKTNNGLVQKDAFVAIARNGVMAQQFGYLEIPMELNYALIDRKFGVDLVGGVSSLFLVDNSVALSSGELTTDVGKANNINNVNFSTNIGFGLNYMVTPRIQMNLEPVFKYQLNTFSNTSGNFQPFSIGVYSGLNFKF